MKSKRIEEKLVLNKVTISNLNGEQMNKIQGGLDEDLIPESIAPMAGTDCAKICCHVSIDMICNIA